MRSSQAAVAAVLASLAVSARAQESVPLPIAPVEFGTVDWLRDFEAARREATAEQRDLLMLFQEVPG